MKKTYQSPESVFVAIEEELILCLSAEATVEDFVTSDDAFTMF